METSDLNAFSARGPAVTDAQLRALLLHRLDDDAAAVVEERLIVEDGVAERLRQIEYELIDGYARGRLSAGDAAAVRQHLLRTERERHRLHLARALARMRLAGPAARWPARLARSWSGRLALAGLAAAAVVAAIMLTTLDPISRRTASPGALAQPASYTVSLLAGVSRGDQAQPIRIPTGTARVRLQAELEQGDAAATYQLRVSDGAGGLLLQVQGLPLRHAGAHAYVETAVAAPLLRPGPRRIEVRRQGSGMPAQYWIVDAGG